jgi:hypothetical protein
MDGRRRVVFWLANWSVYCRPTVEGESAAAFSSLFALSCPANSSALGTLVPSGWGLGRI